MVPDGEEHPTVPAASPSPSSLAARLDDRYGRRSTHPRRRRIGLALLGALAVVSLALLGSAAWRLANPDVRVGVLAFDVVDDTRVDVTFEAVADAQAALQCEVYAQNAYRDVVGSSAVDVAASGQARRVVEASVPTRERAVTGLVQRCRVVPR